MERNTRVGIVKKSCHGLNAHACKFMYVCFRNVWDARTRAVTRHYKLRPQDCLSKEQAKQFESNALWGGAKRRNLQIVD